MEENKFFRFVWRSNAVIIACAGIMIIAASQLLPSSLSKNKGNAKHGMKVVPKLQMKKKILRNTTVRFDLK